jgi:tRNA pseudouridine55 synthase
MGRRRKGRPVHGWVALDKPAGMTSTQAVGVVRRLFDAQKAGHAGTLDPLATGLLPIALGEATKTVPFAVDGEKVYRFEVRWGAETNTDDAEGETVRSSAERPSRAAIKALASQFIGEILQVPPAFSAIKIDGERAYALARSGEAVLPEARAVFVDDLRLMDVPDADTAVFEIRCGKGTYVRSIARDMGRTLASYGHVSKLRRARVGPFEEESSVTLDQLRGMHEAGDSLSGILQPVEAVLGELCEVRVSQPDAARLLQGQPVLMRGRDAPIVTGAAYAVARDGLIALCEIEAGLLRPTRVFNFG